jgi:hypothetical protein
LLADDVVVRPAAEGKQQDRDNEEGEEQAAFHGRTPRAATDISVFSFAWVTGHQHPPRGSGDRRDPGRLLSLKSRKPFGFAGEATLASVGVVENAVRKR